METRRPNRTDGGTRAEANRRSPARPFALGAAATLGLLAAVALWYKFAHAEDGYVTWNRREAADGPDWLVVPTLSRPSDTDDIAPPF